MHVGIILYQNMRYAPYLRVYQEVLSKIKGVDFDVIYLNRCPELDEVRNDNYIPIKWIKLRGKGQSTFFKFLNCFLFSLEVSSVLRKKKYDFLIILTTMPAVLLAGILICKYKKRYIIDIRDYTQESNKIYYAIEAKVINYACMCNISSPGFADFLPKYSYNILHNLNLDHTSINQYSLQKKDPKQKIRIGYIGSIQYAEQCKQMIDLIVLDDRFEFFFYGNEPKGHEIGDYVRTKHCDAIRMMGPFLPSEKALIYSQVDLVFNCYGNKTLLVQKAISNKYYDGALYRKPLLVSPGTLMSSLSGEYAFSLDLSHSSSLNDLWNWYQSLCPTQFDAYALKLLSAAQDNNTQIENSIKAQVIRIHKEIQERND